MKIKDSIKEQLVSAKQEHLLMFWDELSHEQQIDLQNQIEAIDFSALEKLYEHRLDPPASAALADQSKEPTAFQLSHAREQISPVDDNDFQTWAIRPSQAIAAGEQALREGKMAVAVVAGGQGTRLDFPHAKGIYPIGPISGATLFQIHIERIQAMQNKYHVRIPFCIQTSPATHQETIEFFNKNQYFGLIPEDVLIFCQGTIPSMDFTGKILLSAKDRIARNPDGHGGFLAAIHLPQADSPIPSVVEHGILEELKQRGIEELFYFQIDNPLIDICSPEFIGYHLLSRSEYSSQVVRKEAPKDRVGNMVLVDGKLYVIEYCDLPDEAANRRKADGSLEIWAGSIAVHLMNIDFLQRKAFLADSLPYHVAKKKVPYVVLDRQAMDASGNLLFGKTVKPEEPNAIKFEKFIFDLLPQAKNPIVVEVDAKTCFEPLKNHPNQPTNNPQTVRFQLSELYKIWLKNNGVKVSDEVTIEISPLFANSAQELQSKLLQKGLLPSLCSIEQDQYFSE